MVWYWAQAMMYSPWMLRYGASVDALLTCLEAYPYAMMDFWMRVWRVNGLEI